MPSTDRRTLLGAVATGSLLAVAGCSSSCPDEDAPEPDAVVRASSLTSPNPFDSPPDADWPAPRYDAGNTGYAPDATPPSASLDVRWRTSVPAPETDDGAARASAPTVAGDRVFVATAEAATALRFRDGEAAWRSTAVAPNAMRPTYGYEPERVPPVVVDGSVYVGGNDALLALDAADGTQQWRYDGATSFGPPAVVGGDVYALADGALVALDAADGSEHWTESVGVDSGLPAVADGTIVVAGDRTVALDSATGQRRWRNEHRVEFHPVAGDGLVYLGTSEGLRGVGLDDGEVRWTFDRGDGRTLSSPVVTPDSLYLVERPVEAGDATFALDRTGGEPEPRWCSDAGEGAVTAAAGRQVFVLQSAEAPGGRAPSLVAFADRFGDAPWGYAGRDRVLPPAVVDGAVVCVDRRGTVVALGEG